ncbi:MAG: DUF971 family protein [Myxococcota bacterium]|jgi:DUF971 family protein
MRNEAIEALLNQAHSKRERFASTQPETLGWTDKGEVDITFDDGHHSVFSAPFLRAICPCAECRGTHTGTPKAFNVLNAAKLRDADRQTEITRVDPVGNYAIGIIWGDGHKDGIYTWTYLRALELTTA